MSLSSPEYQGSTPRGFGDRGATVTAYYNMPEDLCPKYFQGITTVRESLIPIIGAINWKLTTAIHVHWTSAWVGSKRGTQILTHLYQEAGRGISLAHNRSPYVLVPYLSSMGLSRSQNTPSWTSCEVSALVPSQIPWDLESWGYVLGE